MAVSHANSNLGSVRSQEGMHEYMKEIRSHLLAVGMTELAIEGAYDASEAGSIDQMPPTQSVPMGTTFWSPYMHFAFSDDRASESPIVVSIMAGFGPFFSISYDYRVAGDPYRYPAYSIRVRVSQGVDANGEPLGATLHTNNRGNDGGGTDGRIEDRTGLGSFVRYTGDSLTVFLDHNGTYTVSGGHRGAIQLHVERLTGHDFAVLPLTAGHATAGQNVYYSSGSSIYGNSGLQGRAGGTANLYDKAAAVVTPIYAPTTDGSSVTLKRVFTVPSGIGGDAIITNMDFSGAEKPYLLIKENAMKPYDAGTAWLYEWE